MNIRSVSNPVVLSDLKSTSESKQVKTGESHQDRDSDGRRHEQEPDKSPLTEEEVKRATEYFAGLENFKTNGLTFAWENSVGTIRMLVIRDHLDKIVRRIPEHELRTLVQDKDRKSGKIFDRAG